MVEEHLGQVAHFTYGVVEILRGEELGVGSYGAVYRARCDELVCAAKVLHPILFGGEGGGGGERPIRQFDQECLFLRDLKHPNICLLYTSPSPRDATLSRMPSSA